jgi:hypothetical protein
MPGTAPHILKALWIFDTIAGGVATARFRLESHICDVMRNGMVLVPEVCGVLPPCADTVAATARNVNTVITRSIRTV